MSLTRTVRVVGYIKTNKVGSKCDFEFEAIVPIFHSGESLDDFLEEDAKEAAFSHMEWGFEVKEIEK